MTRRPYLLSSSLSQNHLCYFSPYCCLSLSLWISIFSLCLSPLQCFSIPLSLSFFIVASSVSLCNNLFAEFIISKFVGVISQHLNHTRPLFRLFSVFFKQTSIQFLQQINVKNVYPLYGDVSRTHDL